MSKRDVPFFAIAIGLGASILIPLWSLYVQFQPFRRFFVYCDCEPDADISEIPAIDDFSLPGILRRMDGSSAIAHLAIYALFCAAIAIVVERWLAYYYAERQTGTYAAKVTAAITAHRLDEARNLAADYPKSPLAAVVHVSLHPAGVCAASGEGPSMEAWHHALSVKTAELKRGLWHLSAISWTVPLISLFLLINAVNQSLHNLAGYDNGRFSPYMARDLADKFWPLIFSLMFGVSALWFHKYLTAKCDRLSSETERRSLALLSQIARLPQTIQAHKALRPYDTQPLDLRVTERLTRS